MDHNVYFEGKVQSLSLSTEQGRATVGVITPGKYAFKTSTQERMVVISGNLHKCFIPSRSNENYRPQPGIHRGSKRLL